METLGRVLRNARVSASLTLRQAAEGLGLSAIYISEIENDKKTPEKRATLKVFADFYGLEILDLIVLSKFTQLEQENLTEGFDDEQLAVARKMITSKISAVELAKIVEILGGKS